MNWTPISDCTGQRFGRGTVFKFPAKYPFEDSVEFMVIEDLDAPIRFKLICSTGYHAGQTELVFPKESEHETGGLSVYWVQTNWKKWIYAECNMNEVQFIENYHSIPRR